VAVVVVGWWWRLAHCDCGGALARVGWEVQRGHGGVASGWRDWCCGDLCVGGAEVLLSKQFQVSESLAGE
jgi:hypothetical protein